MRTIKYGAFVLLTLVSGYLSINMFIQLGADSPAKLILALVAMALESTKVFSLLRIEYAMFLRGGNPSIKKPWASIGMYIFLALLSVIASLGFTLVTVDSQVETSKAIFSTASNDYSFEITQLEKSLGLVDGQIAALQDQMSRINPDFATGSVKLSTEAQTLASTRAALIEQISELKRNQRAEAVAVQQTTETNVYGMFMLMGEAIGLPEKRVMAILLFLVSVLIEVSMIYTSPTIIIKEEETHEVVKAPRAIPVQKSKKKPKKVYKKKAPSIESSTQIVEEPTPEEVSPVVADPQPIIEAPIVPVRTVSKHTPTWEELAGKILQPLKDTELKPTATVALETGVSEEKVEDFLARLSKIQGPTGAYLVHKKDNKWHLNYMKDITAQLAMNALKKGNINASKIG